MTNPDFPGPPTIANVTQKGSKVIISWTKPSKPNGILRSYVVKVYYLGQNNTNFDPGMYGYTYLCATYIILIFIIHSDFDVVIFRYFPNYAITLRTRISLE